MELPFELQTLQALSKPDSYYVGRERDPLPVPRNIVVFSRRSASALVAGSLESHHHHRHVLIFALGGTAVVMVNGRRCVLKPGQACLVLPFQVHFYAELPEDRLEWLFVTFEMVHDDKVAALGNQPLSVSGAALSELQRLVQMWRNREEGVAFVTALLLTQLRHEASAAGLSKPPLTHGTTAYGRVNGLIYQSPGRAWGIAELAAKLSISAAHLRAVFRSETGISLGSYLQRIRLNRAAALLVQSADRIGDVSSKCGYDSIYAFSRAFKRQTGMSPKAYREQMQWRRSPVRNNP